MGYILRIRKLEAKVEEAEAKLRELVEAAEWRDECNDLFTDMNIDWINGRPEGPHIDSIYEISEEAEIAYEKALAAATYLLAGPELIWRYQQSVFPGMVG